MRIWQVAIVYLVIGPGDSVIAFIDDRIWLWNEPIHDADFFMPPVSAVVMMGDARAVSSFILITTCPALGCEYSNNLVHAESKRSIDDWSVAMLSGFTVISSHTYLKIKQEKKKSGREIRIIIHVGLRHAI